MGMYRQPSNYFQFNVTSKRRGLLQHYVEEYCGNEVSDRNERVFTVTTADILSSNTRSGRQKITADPPIHVILRESEGGFLFLTTTAKRIAKTEE